MGMKDWLSLIPGFLGAFLLFQQNRILRQQHPKPARQGGAAISRVSKVQRFWPMIAMAALMILTWAAVITDYFMDHDMPKHVEALNDIYDHAYLNETVVLDGNFYHHCTFENVTFEFDGKKHFGMQSSVFRGKIHINSKSETVKSAWDVAKGLGAMPNVIMLDDQNTPSHSVQNPITHPAQTQAAPN